MRANFAYIRGSLRYVILNGCTTVRTFFLTTAAMLICMPTSLHADEAATDVQRLQQQRDQQQLELLLKMQQQRDRAMRPAPNATAEFHTRQL